MKGFLKTEGGMPCSQSCRQYVRLYLPLIVLICQFSNGSSDVTGSLWSITRPNGSFYPSFSVPLSENLSTWSFPVSTRNQYAQNYFNQGIMLLVGKDLLRSHQSFLECTIKDPDCVACFWGAATTLTLQFTRDWKSASYARIRRIIRDGKAAQARQKSLTPSPYPNTTDTVDNELFSALAESLPINSLEYIEKSREWLVKYAGKLSEMSKSRKDDMNLRWLAVEATAWIYGSMHQFWAHSADANLNPAGDVTALLDSLAVVLAKEPNHPGALTLAADIRISSPKDSTKFNISIIHDLTDGLTSNLSSLSSTNVLLAEFSFRLGRFGDTVTLLKQVTRDRAVSWFRQTSLQLYSFRLMGDFTRARSLSNDLLHLSVLYSSDVENGIPIQLYLCDYLYTALLFNEDDRVYRSDLLSLRDLHFFITIIRFARGYTHARNKRIPEANSELRLFSLLLKNVEEDSALTSMQDTYPGFQVLQIQELILKAMIAMNSPESNSQKAAEYFAEAMKIEATLPIAFPPIQWFPVKNFYAAALLQMKEFSQAHEVYLQRLTESKEDVWALVGLQQACEALKNSSCVEEYGDLLREICKECDMVVTSMSWKENDLEEVYTQNSKSVAVGLVAAASAAFIIGYHLAKLRRLDDLSENANIFAQENRIGLRRQSNTTSTVNSTGHMQQRRPYERVAFSEPSATPDSSANGASQEGTVHSSTPAG